MLRDITFSRRKAASSINKATSRHVGVALNEAGANSRGRCLSNLVAPLSTSRNARSGIERKTRIYPTYPATEAKLASSYSKLIQVCGLGSQLTSTVNATAVTRSAMTCPYSSSLRKYASSNFGPTPRSGFTSGGMVDCPGAVSLCFRPKNELLVGAVSRTRKGAASRAGLSGESPNTAARTWN